MNENIGQLQDFRIGAFSSKSKWEGGNSDFQGFKQFSRGKGRAVFTSPITASIFVYKHVPLMKEVKQKLHLHIAYSLCELKLRVMACDPTG